MKQFFRFQNKPLLVKVEEREINHHVFTGTSEHCLAE